MTFGGSGPIRGGMTFGGSGPIRGETTVNDKKTMSYDDLPCHLKTLTISNSILTVIFSNLILNIIF